jgi:hypothetical protein
LGPLAPGVVQFGPPCRAVLGQATLQAPRAHGEPPGYGFQGGSLSEQVGKQHPELPVPGDRLGGRQSGRVPAQDADQHRVRAAQREVQIGLSERQGVHREIEIYLAGAERLGDRPV